MNSATMATNLLGRPVRLKQRPEGFEVTEGQIALVSMDQRGVHFLVLLKDGRLVPVDHPNDLVVLD
jgi:hypothetical protein